MHVVAAAAGELGEHLVRPIGRPGLPAVGDDVLEAAPAHEAAGGVLVLVEIVVEVGLDVGPVELVDLEPGGLGRGRGVAGPGERVAEAEDGPAAGGRGPVEPAVGAHLRGQIDDVGLPDACRLRGRRAWRVRKDRRSSRRRLSAGTNGRERPRAGRARRPGCRRARPAARSGPARSPVRGARVLKLTRKYLAATGAKATVRASAGSLRTARKAWPSSLASSSGSPYRVRRSDFKAIRVRPRTV